MPKVVHRRWRVLIATVGAAALFSVCSASTAAPGPDARRAPHPRATPAQQALAARCPWATTSAAAHSSPSALAAAVVARMTLSEKLGLVNLAYIDGKVVMASPGLHAPGPWSTSVRLSAGRHYALRLDWFMATPETEPTLGLAYQSDDIATAVSAARSAQVAIVFANDFTSEAFDRLNLSLPGDQDALIEAVAAANRRTVVVLNTSGPVLMPWLDKVAGVVEAWYPGQEDGNAIAAVLTGRVDPSGHLPVTFPATASQGPIRSQAQWPGENGKVIYSEGLDIGYRYYNDHNLRPLFPFGFGLSYTTFSLSGASVTASGAGDTVTVDVRNTGHRSGTAVVQAYLTYPAAAGEPRAQLRAFGRATLGPNQSKVVTMDMPRSDFEAYLNGHFVTLPGTYTLALGQSSDNLPLQLNISAP